MEIVLNDRELNDYELLQNGAFFPQTGFMMKTEYYRCIAGETLFPLPVTIHISEHMAQILQEYDSVQIKDPAGLPLCSIDISNHEESIYPVDTDTECTNVFGTLDISHPYVCLLKGYEARGLKYAVGGPIIDGQPPIHYDFTSYRMSPAEIKDYFARNSWTTVIGFQTRNPMHRSHYQLTVNALESVARDEPGSSPKLLIHPAVGITQDVDIDYNVRVKCYEKILDRYAPETAKLAILPLSMRMAGPKEALLHAIVRKNYGCTHFIIGRDHAAPSAVNAEGKPFYDPYAAQKYVEQYADIIGIKIIKSPEIVYTNDGTYNTSYDNMYNGANAISGTELRRMLRASDPIPSWYTFPEIADILHEYYSRRNGLCIYLFGLPCSGKSTIANNLIRIIHEHTNRNVTLLDADVVRQRLSKGLGFNIEDRIENIARIGYVAYEIVKHGGIVVVANIAPVAISRVSNRHLISSAGRYFEVFVNTPIEVCESRDNKGLYAKARCGKLLNFTGVSAPFEGPNASAPCDLEVNGADNLGNILSQIIACVKKTIK